MAGAFERFELLSFDCYGTLIDWETGIASVLSNMLRFHGRRVGSEEILAAYAENELEAESVYVSYRKVLRATAIGVARRFGIELDAREARALEESLPDWPPFPDTVASLRRLATRFRLAVISNVDRDLFAATAARLEVPFDLVVTAEDAQAYKPSLRPFEIALAGSGLDTRRVLHVAQSLFHDIEPAGRLGIDTVWVDRRAGREGFGATPPSEAEADLRVGSLAELVELIMGPP